MNTTAPTHKAEKPTTYESRNVEIFAAGVHRGKRYTVADLNEIVRNFYRLGPKGKQQLQPPAVIGHEEAQEFLERTDIPAAAWPKRVWRKGLKLFADFGEMPAEIAHAINSRAYRKVSAEIYDDFQDSEGNHHGKALRRIAILGGEIPQVKSLADIPYATPEYEGGADAELRLTKASEIEPGVWRVYCERQSYQSFAWVQSKRHKETRYWVPDGQPFRSFAWKKGKRGAQYWLPDGKEDKAGNRIYGKAAEAAAAAAAGTGEAPGGRPKDDAAIKTRLMGMYKAKTKRKAREVGQAAAQGVRKVGKGAVQVDDLGMAIRRIYSRVTSEIGMGTLGRLQIASGGGGKSYLRGLQKAQEREQAAYDRAKEYLARPNTSLGGRKVAQAAISTLGPKIRDIKKALAVGERKRAELDGKTFPNVVENRSASAALNQRIRSSVARKMRWARANRKIYGRGMAVAMDVTRAALTIPEALAKVVTSFPYIRDSQMAQDYISTPLQAISKQLPRAGAKLLSRAGRAVRRRIFGGPAAQQSERFAERALRVWTAIRLDDRKDVSLQQVQRFLRFAEQRVERFGEQAFEGFAAEWKPYTNPKTKQQGAKSAAGRVVYGPLAQKVLVAKAKAPAPRADTAQPGKTERKPNPQQKAATGSVTIGHDDKLVDQIGDLRSKVTESVKKMSTAQARAVAAGLGIRLRADATKERVIEEIQRKLDKQKGTAVRIAIARRTPAPPPSTHKARIGSKPTSLSFSLPSPEERPTQSDPQKVKRLIGEMTGAEKWAGWEDSDRWEDELRKLSFDDLKSVTQGLGIRMTKLDLPEEHMWAIRHKLMYASKRKNIPMGKGIKPTIKARIDRNQKKTGDNLRKAVRKKKTVRKWQRRLRAALVASSVTALPIALGIAFGAFGGPVGAGIGAVVGNAIGGAATGGNGPQPPPPG